MLQKYIALDFSGVYEISISNGQMKYVSVDAVACSCGCSSIRIPLQSILQHNLNPHTHRRLVGFTPEMQSMPADAYAIDERRHWITFLNSSGEGIFRSAVDSSNFTAWNGCANPAVFV